MTLQEWLCLMAYGDFIETERYSMDNHILHYFHAGTKDFEVDENLETMKIKVTEL
jgi:hypothetical protein